MNTPFKEVLEDGTEVYRSSPWSPPGCHPVACGVRLFVKDGKLVKVEGDPNHPVTKGRLCVRCLTLPEYIYHPDRIVHPMKRDPADRGKDKWVQISWDEAIDIAVEKIKANQEKYGLEGSVVLQGTGREPGHLNNILGYIVLQTPNLCYSFSGASCYGPRMAVTNYACGCGYPEIDYAGGFEDRYDDPRFELPKYITCWGKEPLVSNPDGLWGNVIIEMMKRGTKLITIDPQMTWLATRAEHAVRLRPGTDAALGLGFLNVIINEELYDKDFVENYCYGFEQLTERVQEYPPEKVAEICDVPVEQIYEVARALALGHPNSISWGVAVDQQVNGVQVAHIILTIAAITGNLDVPGGTVFGQAAPGCTICALDDSLPPELTDKKLGMDKHPGAVLTTTWCQPDDVLDCLETDEPYPVRLAWIQSTNLLAPTCSAQPHRWMKAIEKLDYIIATDLFMTPTIMACADLFLPVAAFPEHDGVVMNHYGPRSFYMASINKVIDVGETKSDAEIYFLVGKRTNPDKFNVSFEEYLDSEARYTGMTFEELKENGPVQNPLTYKKWETGQLRPDGQPGFNTISGKFECYCNLFESFGDDPLPYFEEPHYSPVSKPELLDEYPLIFTSGGRKYSSFHSEHRQIPSLRAMDPNPILRINPETAKQYGVEDGQWVYVESPFGKAQLVVEVTPIIKPGVVHGTHGWWYPEEEGEAPHLFGVWKSNINELVPHADNGIIGFGAPYKNMLCKIYPVE